MLLTTQSRPAAIAPPEQVDWRDIFRADTPLVLEPRSPPLAVGMLPGWPWTDPVIVREEVVLGDIERVVATLPPVLARDIAWLAGRFAHVMAVSAIRIRLETITGNACSKVHADYTDVRLITTYIGAGTDYAIGNDADAGLARIATGWIGLFKGHCLADGHQPCLHRSPPIAGTHQRRLVLVIDTPVRATPDHRGRPQA